MMPRSVFPICFEPARRSFGASRPRLFSLLSAGFAAAQDAPLKVAVYDAPPYGHLEPDGSIDGVSVDLGAAPRKASGASIISSRSARWRTSSKVSSARTMTQP